ncbi:hypothetical protein EE612_027172 [Oryza sativa]|nr:hypothetical protein EE612_027172 [Oryza sativa]
MAILSVELFRSMMNCLCSLRWNKAAEWESSYPNHDFEWKHNVEPVMQVYTETTDGSSIEPKESALLWHYLDADHDFGSWQAKELLGHLERVLSNEPVVVKCGHYIVEVKPQGVSKGLAVDKKPSKAKYYVDDAGEVVRLLKNVAGISSHREAVSHGRVIFRDVMDYVD